MLVTLAGIVTDVSPEPENAVIPMFVTLFGIAIDISSEQFKNASSPILVTAVPISTFIVFSLSGTDSLPSSPSIKYSMTLPFLYVTTVFGFGGGYVKASIIPSRPFVVFLNDFPKFKLYLIVYIYHFY